MHFWKAKKLIPLDDRVGNLINVCLATSAFGVLSLWKHGYAFIICTTHCTPKLGRGVLTLAQWESRGTYLKTGVSTLSLKWGHPWKTMAYPKWVPDKHGVHQEFKQAPDGNWEESSSASRDGWIEDGSWLQIVFLSAFVFELLCCIAHCIYCIPPSLFAFYKY